jgi:uncharacterized protein
MKLVIPGGTGQVGTILARAFHKDRHEVVVLSRKPKNAAWRVVEWDGERVGAWVSEFEGADAVINLAGRSVNCRYNSENRQLITQSRVQSTRVVGEAIAGVSTPPRLWLQMSTATIYAHRFDAPNDEETGIIGGDEPDVPDTWRFSIEVAKSWEEAIDQAFVPQTRKVKMRSAMVMSPDSGGVFDMLLTLVRYGLGGRAGRGDQFVSWIHYKDFIRAVYWIIQHEDLKGEVNLSAPNPLPNTDFMQILRESWRIKFGLPATDWMLEVGARLLRTETELILKSRRVVPGKLLQSGFTFLYPDWSKAALDLCQQWCER